MNQYLGAKKEETHKLTLTEASFVSPSSLCHRPRVSLASAAVALAEGYAAGLERLDEGGVGSVGGALARVPLCGSNCGRTLRLLWGSHSENTRHKTELFCCHCCEMQSNNDRR